MRCVAISWALSGALLFWLPAQAAGAASRPPAVSPVETAVAMVQQALDERRLLNADQLLTEAALSHLADPRLTVLDGELDLLRGRYADSLAAFKEAEKSPVVLARALQDEGIALSLLGRSDEALATLQRAVGLDASLWRAWNALGSEYDTRGRWSDAETAYQHALAASADAALVLNNRGYSRLLQHRRDDAVADFVAALRKKPDLAAARTNLRLALAMGGEYQRAVAGGSSSERAALLNNAGFAAAMRGDYADAEELLNQAIKTKGEYYAKASENLRIVEALNSEDKKATNAAP
jgi:Flp pilus assembly protein TadD